MENHHFGEVKVSLLKLPNKVLLEIAGSFPLLLLLLLSQRESIECSKIPNIPAMVPSKCSSTSEVRKSPSSLMIEFQFLTLAITTKLHIHQSTPNHPHKELGG